VTKPRIGITRSGSAERIAPSYLSYHERVRAAGGELVDLHTALDASAGELIASLDALLLSGGPDVLPERYGATRAPETDQGDAARDALEFALLDAALARDLPVLAICRGQQVLNVALGGALIQHIAGDTHRALDEGRGDSRWHDVTVEPSSMLASLVDTSRVRTNSRHHQAVADEALGRSLVITARADDGIIEGLELPNRRWVLAVQWHPERAEIGAQSRPLFEAFIAAAAGVPAVSGSG